MERIWIIPVLVSILIVGSLGFSQDVMADHIVAHVTACDLAATVGGGALGLSPGPGAPPVDVLGWDVGSGQCNGSFSSVTDPAFTGGALELALRAEQRSVGQVALSPINDYTVQLGQDTTQPNVQRAWWNFQGSAAYDGVITDLDSLTLTITTVVGPNLPAAPVFDLLFIDANIAPINDRNNKPNPTLGFSDFFQISQNPEFGWFTPTSDTDGNPSLFDYSVPGAWLFTLTAVRGASTSSVSVCIHTPGEDCIFTVDVDIKPGSDPSSVNCKKLKGTVPVAIFGDQNFDATTIDIEILSMSLVGSSPITVTEKHDKLHIDDLNDDGFDDVVLHLDKAGVCEATEDAPLKQTVEVELTGETTDGIQFIGTGDIQIVKRSSSSGSNGGGSGGLDKEAKEIAKAETKLTKIDGKDKLQEKKCKDVLKLEVKLAKKGYHSDAVHVYLDDKCGGH